ncbi:STM3941 family protein [Flavobacterium sp. 20NA77.7]|uniref:STM3941 family protein n=1 Tax=Flavobacterium nakdongensis TaxID=3073563 RepID=A0ABY9RC98_9FLAO|nr:STM3941 family protein [Flavobacterium sp. 20NA77.7]WMW77817.1 STM3941 family protein [Flavobacterium sp. 20NA77.7]
MKEEHYYSNKLTSFLLLLISSIFVVAGILLGEKMIDFKEKLFKSVILIFGFLLFLFGIILSVLLLKRKKPLLTITNSELIIHSILAPSNTIPFNNIKSFFIINTRYRGIKTNKQIFVELKNPTEKHTKTWFYKFLCKISIPIANSQYSIQTNFLNIKQKELLEQLNKKIKNIE